MPQSYVNLIYHIVFSTKDRKPIITDAYRDRLHEYIGGMVRGQGGIALAINGMDDHRSRAGEITTGQSLV